MPRGTLEALLIGAKGLKNTDHLKKSDPYAIVAVRSQVKKSSIASKQGSDPQWSETLLFTIEDGTEELSIKIMDSDAGDDDFVGELMFKKETLAAAAAAATKLTMEGTAAAATKRTMEGIEANTPLIKPEGSVTDHGSPYYLHPSDNPRQMHVNDVLTDSNYLYWVHEMEKFLFIKNKIGFIDGSIVKPEATDEKYMAWKRCDAMIKGWLTTAMDNEIQGSVKYTDSAAEIWTYLRERFGKESALRAYELQQLISHTKQEGMTVSAYYTKLCGLWNKLQFFFPTPKCTYNGCRCGLGKLISEHQEKEQLYVFLMGLDNEFSITRTQILAMEPTPTLLNAYRLVAEDEQQRSITGGKRPTIKATMFKAAVRSSPYRSVQKEGKQQFEHCDFCHREGHYRDGCFKRIGYPEWWPAKGKREKGKPKGGCVEVETNQAATLTKEQYDRFLHHLKMKETSDAPRSANMVGNTRRVNEWIVKSGCTEHISHRKNILEGR